MSAAATSSLREFAAFEWPQFNHKGRLRALSRKLPWSDRRVRAIYNGESGVSLRADEFAAIEELHQRKIEEANRNDFQALQARIARLEAALFAQDQEFHHDQVAALRRSTHSGR